MQVETRFTQVTDFLGLDRPARHSSTVSINLQAQRGEPARSAHRHTDQARQPLARRPHRRTEALGLHQSRAERRQRVTATTSILPRSQDRQSPPH